VNFLQFYFLHSNDYHDILTCKYVLCEFWNLHLSTHFVDFPKDRLLRAETYRIYIYIYSRALVSTGSVTAVYLGPKKQEN
jgi:hypothetical protein